VIWKTVKINDACLVTDYVANGSFKSLSDNVKYLTNDGYAILVRLTDFTKGWNGDYKYVDEHAYNFLAKTKLFAGDLIISNVGEPGKTFLVPELDMPMTLGPNSILVRPNNNILNTKYFKYLIDSLYGKSLLDKIISGTTQKKFNKTGFRNLEIPLPPLAEQERIVAKLDATFAEIEALNKQVPIRKAELIKLKKALLLKTLSSEKTDLINLGDVCELIYGKGLDKTDRLENGGIPAYGANGIKAYSTKILSDEPSIIIGRKGSAGELTKVSSPFWALDVTYYTKINKELINLDFLYYTLSTMDLPSMAKGVKPGINRNDVYKRLIYLPTLEKQKNIVSTLDAIYAEIEKVNDSVSKLENNCNELKTAILKEELQSSEAA
tara:strand:- start:1018 stop:2157 length:1140 start_codon:yes stop_codon:yes gene_type:complete